MGLLSKKDDIDLSTELLAMRQKVEDLEDMGKTDSQIYKNFIDQIDKYEQEQYLRRPEALATKPGINGQSNVRGGFKNFGEQLGAIANAAVPGRPTDARLYNAATGLGTTVSSDGGFLVQQDFSNELLGAMFDTGKLAELCNRIRISGNANGIKLPMLDETSRVSGSRLGSVVSYYVAEAGTITASKPKFRMLELDLKKLTGLCYATDELLADASVLESVIRQSFASEFGFRIDDGIINGSGAGQPLGILNGGGLVTVDKQGGQAGSTVILENVIDMWARLLPGSQENAVWLCNTNVLPQLYQMSLAVGTGGAPVFLPGGGASDAPYASLFGRPLIPIEQCQTLGTAGDLILGDFQNGYVIADKGGIQTDMSIHVQFLADESVFRFIYRWDGSPTLASSITPYKGSDDLGHFVALQSRA